ncbi:cell wall-binding protein [Clostridium boliviensis]|uniref:Cell wall-binding protein n=1 Tax=Clostridium boliviensis TaxID=318465 RepID=A0ABU4GS57_9CLOT|nr:cell wall-binding protein [Clostridium boliviensis]MDW2800456.1 cell wall-binding protein [Clostridium boliviensis]
MNMRKIMALVLTAALAAGMNCTTASAASRKKITTVNLTVSADIAPGGTISEQQAEVTAKSNKIEVDKCEFINDGFEWTESDIPRLEVTLHCGDDYYFSTSENSFTINGGTYVKQKKEDFSQTLILTMDLPSVSEFTQAISSASWNGTHIANWSASVGAGCYEVKLYRDGKGTGAVKTTDKTSMELGSFMTREGNYKFQVRPVNAKKPENKGEWVESPSQYVNSDDAKSNYMNFSGSWKQDQTGWWYVYGDGSYPKNSWQNINGEWYFFNEEGYMATGWIDWNGKQYYCDTQTGHMLTDGLAPDGARVGSDGARLP